MRQSLNFFLVLLCLGWTVFGGVTYARGQEISFQKGDLRLYRQNSEILYFSIEIAQTEKERLRGLMFRDHLDFNEGMLFVYPMAQKVGIWMKNTYIPLDLLFLNENLQIVEIVQGMKPMSQDIVYSKNNVKYVLEISAGIVQEKNIQIGEVIEYREKKGI